jgi:hypothetical protein
MGRSIPSFRQLIEIEHLVWSEFKKELKNRNDKKALDNLFEFTKLYTPYLSFANRPIPVEPIFMGMIFHLYKTILDLANNKEFGVDQEIVTLEIFKPETLCVAQRLAFPYLIITNLRNLFTVSLNPM